MAHQIMALATKADNDVQSPNTHMVEEEDLLQVAL